MFTAFEEARYIPGKNCLGGSAEIDTTSQGWVTAVNASTGEELYRFNTGGSMGGGIGTYGVNGTQYIAAASGGASNFWVDAFAGAPTIVVFKLP
jgi:alcohol dehydrogenase (cytochrome c)